MSTTLVIIGVLVAMGFILRLIGSQDFIRNTKCTIDGKQITYTKELFILKSKGGNNE